MWVVGQVVVSSAEALAGVVECFCCVWGRVLGGREGGEHVCAKLLAASRSWQLALGALMNGRDVQDKQEVGVARSCYGWGRAGKGVHLDGVAARSGAWRVRSSSTKAVVQASYCPREPTQIPPP